MAAKTRQPKPKAPPQVLRIPLDELIEPILPARSAANQDAILELAHSIKRHGQLQPICVRPHGKKFEIVFGHRRFLAHRRLGRPTINATVQNFTDAELYAARLVENFDRQNMSIFEEATALATMQKELDCTQKQLATQLGRSEAWISQRIAVHGYPDILQNALKSDNISFSVARLLAKIRDPLHLAYHLRAAVDNGATPAVVERWVTDLQLEENRTSEGIPGPPPTYDYEPIATRGNKCYFCDSENTYANMTNIWTDKTCLRAAIDALLQVAKLQEAPLE